jgi:hypothetical protein
MKLKRILGQALLMVVLLGLCGQGACSRYFIASASTGSYMNAVQGGEPTAVRLFIYQLTQLPPSLPTAGCSELLGQTPSGLPTLNTQTQVIAKSIFPGFEKSVEYESLGGTLDKATEWLLVVPEFYECRDDKPRWVAFRMGGNSGTEEVAFQLQGYSIRPHPSMREVSCTNLNPQACISIGR